MSTNYTHFDQIAFDRLFGRRSDGQEIQVMDAAGNLTIAGLTVSGDITVNHVLDVQNVKHFGAVGDGVTNDTTAIQNTINAVEAAGAGIVFFPAATYLHTGLTFTKGITIQGEGWTTILRNTSAVNHSISNSVTGATTGGFRIANIKLDHTGGGSAVDGIHFNQVQNHLVIDRVYIANAPRDGISIQAGNSSDHYSLYPKILWPLIEAPGRHGIYINGPANSGILTGGRVDGGTGAYNFLLEDTITGSPGSYPNAWAVTGVDLPGGSPAAGLKDDGLSNRYYGLRFEANTVDIVLGSHSGNAMFYGTYFSTSGVVTDGSASRPVFFDKTLGVTGIPALNVNGNATAKAFIPSSSTLPVNGIYLPSANTVGIATNSTANASFSNSGGPIITLKTTSGQTSNILNNVGDAALVVSGGTGSNGGFATFYGATHATNPNKTIFTNNSVNRLTLDTTGASVTGTLAATGAVSGSNLSGTNTGDVTIGTANGLSLAGQALSMAAASSSAAGVLSTGAQSIAGAKTFTSSISASNLSGTNTGNQTITLTSDVTGSGTGSFATTIAANVVTNAKAAQMAANTIKGNNTAGTANALDLTAAQATAMLSAASTSAQGVMTTGTQSFAGTKTFINAPAIKGLAAGSTAAAGNVGEVLVSTVATVSVGTSTQRFDIASLSLTAGNWLVESVVYYSKNGATLTAASGWELGLSTTTGNSTTGLTIGDNYLSQSWPDVSNVSEMSMALPGVVVSPSSTTTYFLKGRGVYSAGTPQATGRIRAVRLP